MRFGLDVPVGGAYADSRLLGRMAAEAEQAGRDGFFVQDVLNSTEPVADPWICLAGVYLMTVHQHTRQLLGPSDVAEVVAAIAALRRAGRDDFEVAFNAIPSADPATHRRPGP
jgi:alkanesulfonate monooxygenase SsuD/methylene tetrahydromethanopterin reductase-like flavin-dependent oxidoreductase (luciferase family)